MEQQWGNPSSVPCVILSLVEPAMTTYRPLWCWLGIIAVHWSLWVPLTVGWSGQFFCDLYIHWPCSIKYIAWLSLYPTPKLPGSGSFAMNTYSKGLGSILETIQKANAKHSPESIARPFGSFYTPPISIYHLDVCRFIPPCQPTNRSAGLAQIPPFPASWEKCGHPMAP